MTTEPEPEEPGARTAALENMLARVLLSGDEIASILYEESPDMSSPQFEKSVAWTLLSADAHSLLTGRALP